MALAEAAIEHDMLVAPGALFSPVMAPSRKMRFDVDFCHTDEKFHLLEALFDSSQPPTIKRGDA